MIDTNTILEPFAGSNNIVKLMQEAGYDYKWKCYDIKPDINTVKEYPIEKRDTIKDFPKGYTVVITNPPYLAKSSATKKKIIYPEYENNIYNDLYKLCLDKCLSNADYVAAIIPESFIKAELFHNRIYSIISLTYKMFNDTEIPVCLALFVPESDGNFKIYNQDKLLGRYQDLKNKHNFKSNRNNNWIFNDKTGSIGIHCLDNTTGASIRFCRGETIDSNNIKISSRAITRVSGLPENIDLDIFIEKCNEVLKEYRTNTCDIFLVAFRGLRKDGCYRRRLYYGEARNIMNYVLEELEEHNSILQKV